MPARTDPRRRRRARAAAPLAVLAAFALVLSGCGGIEFADLFVVTRTGSVPGAKFSAVVNDSGTVRCNGSAPRELPGPMLLSARVLQRAIVQAAMRHERLPPLRGSVLQYAVRSQDGTIAFADNSRGQPAAFFKLAQLTRQIAQGPCGLVR